MRDHIDQGYRIWTILAGTVLTSLFIANKPCEGASISITAIDALSFGKFSAGSGGTVTVAPNGSRSRTGGVALLSSSTGGRARFRLTGDPSAAYVITLPSDNEASLSSGGDSMSLTQFTSSSGLTGTLDGTGTADVTVGATLVVDPNKSPANYSGTYTITVVYQ